MDGRPNRRNEAEFSTFSTILWGLRLGDKKQKLDGATTDNCFYKSQVKC